jgi:hypothetical protein
MKLLKKIFNLIWESILVGFTMSFVAFMTIIVFARFFIEEMTIKLKKKVKGYFSKKEKSK